MKLSIGFRDRFLANVHEIWDFAILNFILTITYSRLLISLEKLKFSGPYCRVYDDCVPGISV
jgi:hypothetical protein